MTRCGSEDRYPIEGLAWKAPDSIPCRLETARLVLRTYTLEDIQAVNESVRSSLEHLTPWMPWAVEEQGDPAATSKYISDLLVSYRKPETVSEIGLGIFERETGAHVGGTGVHDLRRESASAETGYWVRRDRAGQGYVTESCRRVLSWALAPQSVGGLGLNRVRIYCSSENRASQRIPEKIGLRREVCQREDYFIPTLGLTDRLGWGVLASEWDCAGHQMRAEDGA